MKTRGYKETLTNLIDYKVRQFAEKKANDSYCRVESIQLEIDKDLGFPTFEAVIWFGYHDYTVHGYLTEYCDVSITSVHFDRTYITVKDGNEQRETKSNFIIWSELGDFHFDY